MSQTNSASKDPFGQQLPLSSIAGPTYTTTQTLVQQVAYSLSDKLFTYSPDTFDLDTAAKQWSAMKETNANDQITSVHSMQIRAGAGSIALGYIFSKDFDVKRRHIPQAVLASSSSLPVLQPALDQLSLLYSVSNPFVAHIAAVDYAGGKGEGLVTDYATTLATAEELGYGLVCSNSAHESQHMALLATLLAQLQPVLHVYDGVRAGRDVTRVIDTLDTSGLKTAYDSVLEATKSEEQKYLNTEGKTLRTLKALNEELGTDYKCFESYGHESPEAVLVCFGSVEASLGSQVAASLAQTGKKVGIINVRVYRPFLGDEFLKLVPNSVKFVGVLGQVHNTQVVQEAGIRSQLYEDVLAALTHATSRPTVPEIRDIKYSRSERWTPGSVAAVFNMLLGKDEQDVEQTPLPKLLDDSVKQFTFWEVDDSPSASAAALLARALSKDSSQNVTISTTHDNLVQGGSHRTDVRKSPKSLDAPYPVDRADTVVVGNVELLKKIDILVSIKEKGNLILILPATKDDDVEKKLPTLFKQNVAGRGIKLYLIDPSRSSLGGDVSEDVALILQTAFLRVALAKSEGVGLQKLASPNSGLETLEKVTADLEKTLRQIEVPQSWVALEAEKSVSKLPKDITSNSFTTFDKTEVEEPSLMRNWQKAAKALLFKEAYGTKESLRPDLPIKTYTVHVKENRRLTPKTYDRNIFHIEFDLGTSGLKYDIGEALGIHAENNHDQAIEFIKWYNVNPDDVVEIASRDNSSVLENRTVYQALMQNIDIFGRPPKKFYENLAEYATNETEKKNLLTLAGPEGYKEFQRRAEVDTVTYVDVLQEFPSARPTFDDLTRIVAPMKRREYSIASCQAVTPTSIALMVVVVGWVDPRGRDRFGQATRYLWKLHPGQAVTVSVKPSVMKLPPNSTQPIIMAGLGTGLAPFRAFVQHRAMEKAQGKPIGSVLLYMGSRHQREEYCYGEEWEAYQAAGVITLLGRAFSRDQPQKIYIQDRMRQTLDSIIDAYIKQDGVFYLCGPTWPVPDVTNVLEQAITREARTRREKKRLDPSREIMRLKDEGRYVLEVY